MNTDPHDWSPDYRKNLMASAPAVANVLRPQGDYAIIGPARSNVAAIRSYEKIGFRYLKEYREEDTTDPDHVLLDLRRSDLV